MSVRDFPGRPEGATFDSSDFLGWLDKLRDRQNIDYQIALTTPDAADETYIFDASASATRKITMANLFVLALFPIGTAHQVIETNSGATAAQYTSWPTVRQTLTGTVTIDSGYGAVWAGPIVNNSTFTNNGRVVTM